MDISRSSFSGIPPLNIILFVLFTGYKMSHELLKAAYDLSFYSSEFEKEQYQFLGGMYRLKKGHCFRFM